MTYASEAFELIQMNEAYKRGIPPTAGAYMDQPKNLMIALQYVAMHVQAQEQAIWGALAPMMAMLR